MLTDGPMPYKANADRRHKIPKTRYRVTNWPDYDAALVRRGSLTLWITEEALAAWHAPATGAEQVGPVCITPPSPPSPPPQAANRPTASTPSSTAANNFRMAPPRTVRAKPTLFSDCLEA